MRRIAIAIGDPNGIGPEIAVRAAITPPAGVDPVLVGDRHVIDHYVQRFAPGASMACVDVKALAPDAFSPGTLSPDAGAATVAYCKRAVDLALHGEVDAVVGCPHSETAVNRAGIAFNGYTGLVADLTQTPRSETFMLLAAAGLRIAHVTLHESVAQALARLTPALVMATTRATVSALQTLGVNAPKLALFGINPHASEDGLFGDEDARITLPAATQLRAEGIQLDGPVGADMVLAQRRHDAYIAIFHDQGHIPVKLLSPLRASALTIGVPILFSSVAHGCAFDIAGQGIADPKAVLETLALLVNT
jgi:4-hydroxy-L-threonine phosphate dehydrogenase PdxA